jgi:alkylation response protein AidB-like acyl-CoA dehydrogenase
VTGAERIAEAVAGCAPAERFETFFRLIRGSEIPYVACDRAITAERLYDETFRSLFILGSASLPLAVGLTMHQYVTCALATMPIRDPELSPATHRLLSEIRDRRELIAIGSVGDNVRPIGVPRDTIAIVDGRAKGRTRFTSMASQADRLTFIGSSGEALGFYVVRTRAEGVSIGDRAFTDAMADADTRSIEVDAPIDGGNVLTRNDDLTRFAMYYGTAWFEGLISAAYLGAAARALDAARAFAHSVAAGGAPLADLDGVRVEIGRLGIQLEAALGLRDHVARSFARLGTGDPRRAIDDLVSACAVAKHASTRIAEEIVTGARRLIGARSMAPGSIVQEISQQVAFGPLHPKVSAIVERDMGERILSFGSFLDFAPCSG